MLVERSSKTEGLHRRTEKGVREECSPLRLHQLCATFHAVTVPESPEIFRRFRTISQSRAKVGEACGWARRQTKDMEGSAKLPSMERIQNGQIQGWNPLDR